MYQELDEWIEVVLSPQQCQLVRDTFEAMVSISDYSIDEIAINIANDIDRTETSVLVNRLYSDLARYPEELLAQYGIFLNIDVIEQSTLPVVLSLMQTVSFMASWDEPSELLHILDSSTEHREALSEITEVITGTDAESVLEVLLRVEDSLILALTVELKRIARVNELLNGESINEDLMSVEILELIKLLPKNSPVTQWVNMVGTTNIKWQHLDTVKETLAEQPPSNEIVLSWYVLARMGGYTSVKDIKTLITITLELLRPEDINYHMSFSKLFDSTTLGIKNV